jgi:hypothetical protein
MSLGAATDAELEAVKTEALSLDPNGSRTAQVLRDTFDQIYDGQRTGRYCWDKLHKTEKTHFGTLVEINLHREFNFGDGIAMDYQIAGIEVDCKYSQRTNAWMIPPETRGHLCLVVSAEDNEAPKWSMGLVRAKPEYLNTGANRDAKSTFNDAGRNAIVWLYKKADLPPNVLLQLDRSIVDKIFEKKSGQKRINELFRNTLGMRVGRAVIATVAQQDDYMKRVRGNGGARSALKTEGIILLGQYLEHVEIAEALGVPTPGKGETVSVRVISASGPGTNVSLINGSYWRKATSQDPVAPAPKLLKPKRSRRVTNRLRLPS